MNKKIILTFLLTTLTIMLVSCSSQPNISQEKIDTFANCLTENDVVMYGAFWCPHCSRSKKAFGTSFKHINYVECDPRGENEQSELCIEKGIDKYDTWEFADGSRLVSEPSFAQLAEKSGCEEPKPDA